MIGQVFRAAVTGILAVLLGIGLAANLRGLLAIVAVLAAFTLIAWAR